MLFDGGSPQRQYSIADQPASHKAAVKVSRGEFLSKWPAVRRDAQWLGSSGTVFRDDANGGERGVTLLIVVKQSGPNHNPIEGR